MSSIKSSDVGLAMLKKDWQEAIELILKPRGNESPQMTRMKLTGGCFEILAMLWFWLTELVDQKVLRPHSYKVEIEGLGGTYLPTLLKYITDICHGNKMTMCSTFEGCCRKTKFWTRFCIFLLIRYGCRDQILQ